MNKPEILRIPAIDVLKGLSAFAIAFIFHYQHFGQNCTITSFFELVRNHGYLLVDLFFALSGFGIALGYQDKIKNRKTTFNDFIKKRLAKFYPTHLITLIIVLLIQSQIHKIGGHFFIYQNNDLWHFLTNLILFQNGILGTEWSFNGPSWCLSIFLFCYIVFFGIFYSTTNTRLLIYNCIIIALVGALFITEPSCPIINYQIGRGLTGFSLGVILFYFYNCKRYLHVASIISFAILILGCWGLKKNPDLFQDIQPIFLQYFFIFFLTPLIIIASCFNVRINLLLNNRFIRYIGKMSSSIYLWHFPVQCFMKYIGSVCSMNINYSSMKIWIAYCGLTIGISAIDCFFISKYSRMILHFLKKR